MMYIIAHIEIACVHRSLIVCVQHIHRYSQRAHHTHQSPIQKSPMYTQKSPTYMQKSPTHIHVQKKPKIYAATYSAHTTHTSRPCKRAIHLHKRAQLKGERVLYIYTYTKELCIYAATCSVHTTHTSRPCKRALYAYKRAPHIRKKVLHIYKSALHI